LRMVQRCCSDADGVFWLRCHGYFPSCWPCIGFECGTHSCIAPCNPC
jgi:hypothetical protein